MQMVTVDATSQLVPELLPGESLLWQGQPSRSVIFHRTDWTAIPFSLLWGGFSIFWEASASEFVGRAHTSPTSPPELFFILWGIPFILAGQYIIWGRFLYVAWKKARTFYGLTNKRVLVVNAGRSRTVASGHLHGMDSVTLMTRPDGIGTIEFAPEPFSQSVFSFFKRGGNQQLQMGIDLSRLAFYDIPNAATVYIQIQSLRDRAN